MYNTCAYDACLNSSEGLVFCSCSFRIIQFASPNCYSSIYKHAREFIIWTITHDLSLKHILYVNSLDLRRRAWLICEEVNLQTHPSVIYTSSSVWLRSGRFWPSTRTQSDQPGRIWVELDKIWICWRIHDCEGTIREIWEIGVAFWVGRTSSIGSVAQSS